MNHVEVEARYEIGGEYTKKIQIEGRVLGIFQQNHINSNSNSLPNTLIDKCKD
jgi:glutamine synthetase